MLISKQEFNQNHQQAFTQNEPVFITEQGQITNVVLSYDEYQKIQQQLSKPKTLLECFAQGNPNVADVEFELPPRSKIQRPPVEFD